jgi:8-oxo-dGTP pyrophosphatase MutT (NUDIX family)
VNEAEKAVAASVKQAKEGYDENGFWVGEGGGASGILPICRKTKRICVAWRSMEVESPDCWGTIGGAIKDGMSPEASAKDELAEEMGYHGGIEMHTAYVFSKGSFKYHNFIGVVDEEFSLQPEAGHGWETAYIVWRTLQEIEGDIRSTPGDFHPGVIALFKNSRDLIYELAGTSTKRKANFNKQNPDVNYPEETNGYAIWGDNQSNAHTLMPVDEMVSQSPLLKPKDE